MKLSDLWRKKDPLVQAKAKQPDSMKLCVAEYLNHYPEAEIKVFQLGTRSGRQKHVGYIAVRTAADHMARIEELIKAEYGGGDYRLIFYDPADKQFAAYEYGIAGKSNYAEADDGGRLRGGDGQFLKEIGMDTLKSRLDPSTQLEAYARIFQMMQPQGKDGFRDELMTVLINNHFEKQENQFGQLKEALDVMNTLQPKVQGEDPTISLITSLAPIVAQMAASRQGGGVSPQVQALLQHPEVAKAIAIAQAELAGAPQNAALPEPGQQKQPLEPAEEKQPEAEQAGDAESPVIASAMASFREHVKRGTPASTLTEMFLSMVGLARAWQPDHPLFAPLIGEDDWLKLSEAFDAFCNAVPELAGNAALQNEIKVAIAGMLYSEGPDEAEQPEPDEQEEQDADVEAAARWPEPDRVDSGETGREVEPALAGGNVQGS